MVRLTLKNILVCKMVLGSSGPWEGWEGGEGGRCGAGEVPGPAGDAGTGTREETG